MVADIEKTRHVTRSTVPRISEIVLLSIPKFLVSENSLVRLMSYFQAEKVVYTYDFVTSQARLMSNSSRLISFYTHIRLIERDWAVIDEK